MFRKLLILWMAGLLSCLGQSVALAGKPPDLPVILHDQFILPMPLIHSVETITLQTGVPMDGPMKTGLPFLSWDQEPLQGTPGDISGAQLLSADCPGPGSQQCPCKRTKGSANSSPLVKPLEQLQSGDVLTNLASLLSADEVTQVSAGLLEKGIDPTEGKKLLPEHGCLTIGFSFFPLSIHWEITEKKGGESTDEEMLCPCGAEPGVREEVSCLRKACHLAMETGRFQKAIDLFRELQALDSTFFALDPVLMLIAGMESPERKQIDSPLSDEDYESCEPFDVEEFVFGYPSLTGCPTVCNSICCRFAGMMNVLFEFAELNPVCIFDRLFPGNRTPYVCQVDTPQQAIGLIMTVDPNGLKHYGVDFEMANVPNPAPEAAELLEIHLPDIEIVGNCLRFGWQVLVGPWSCQLRYDRAGLSLETQYCSSDEE